MSDVCWTSDKKRKIHYPVKYLIDNQKRKHHVKDPDSNFWPESRNMKKLRSSVEEMKRNC